MAKLYNVGTKVLNQTIKRNINSFPKIFCFQLTEEEYETSGRSSHHEDELYYAEELKKLIEMGYLDGCYLNGKLIDSKKYEKDIIARITSSIEEQKNNFKK